jgi:hypothetical protein
MKRGWPSSKTSKDIKGLDQSGKFSHRVGPALVFGQLGDELVDDMAQTVCLLLGDVAGDTAGVLHRPAPRE